MTLALNQLEPVGAVGHGGLFFRNACRKFLRIFCAIKIYCGLTLRKIMEKIDVIYSSPLYQC